MASKTKVIKRAYHVFQSVRVFCCTVDIAVLCSSVL